MRAPCKIDGCDKESRGRGWCATHVLYGLLSEARGIDFNRVIPQPPDEDPIFTATRTDYGDGGVGYALDGYSPLDWAREHWGTKWNAYRHGLANLDQGEIQFQAAWNHPWPVMKALSENFPNDLISVHFADEDIGWTIRNGLVTARAAIRHGTPAAIEFATAVWAMETP